jgi:hypothetical protein
LTDAANDIAAGNGGRASGAFQSLVSSAAVFGPLTVHEHWARYDDPSFGWRAHSAASIGIRLTKGGERGKSPNGLKQAHGRGLCLRLPFLGGDGIDPAYPARLANSDMLNRTASIDIEAVQIIPAATNAPGVLNRVAPAIEVDGVHFGRAKAGDHDVEAGRQALNRDDVCESFRGAGHRLNLRAGDLR